MIPAFSCSTDVARSVRNRALFRWEEVGLEYGTTWHDFNFDWTVAFALCPQFRPHPLLEESWIGTVYNPLPYQLQFLSRVPLLRRGKSFSLTSPSFPLTFTPMVGYIPPTMALRKKKLVEMVQQVETSWKSIDPQGTSSVLHYDYREGKLSVWYWPVQLLPAGDSSDDDGDDEMEGTRVPPDALDGYRYTHHFKGPCCLCAFLDVSEFTEAKMGLLQTVGLNGSLVGNLGQYAAVCAKQRCGYFVVLENFYAHRGLRVKAYVKRDKPLATLDPFTFITDDTEETAKRAGLCQVRILQDEGEPVLRGSRTLLRREDPNSFVKAEERMERLMFRGLPAEQFWEVFVQCVDCKRVIPRHYYPYIHECVVGTLKAEHDKYSSLLRRRLQQIDDLRTASNAEPVPAEFSESELEARHQIFAPGPSNFQATTATARRRSRVEPLPFGLNNLQVGLIPQRAQLPIAFVVTPHDAEGAPFTPPLAGHSSSLVTGISSERLNLETWSVSRRIHMPNAAMPPQGHTALISTLQRAIYLSFSSENSQFAPSPTRNGPGWLYHLEDSQVYFSPNCDRFGLKLPTPLRLSNGGPLAGRDYDTQLIRQAQWWTKMHGYMAFTPLSPDLSAQPLNPLLYLPQVLYEAELGPHPEGPAWAEWIDLERRVAQSISLLLGASGAPAVRPVLPPVSDALVQDANNFSSSSPPSWVDILLQGAGGAIDWTFVSHLRNTCLARFDASIERAGVFVELPDNPEDVISIDFLCNYNVPVFYRWGSREEGLSEKYPSLRKYRPTSDAIRVPNNGEGCSLPQSPQAASSQFADFEWFLALKIREEVLKVTETDEERTRREHRQRNPPTDPSKTRFYVWDSTEAQGMRRRVARDEDIKGLFKREGRFGTQQARYNAFYNEWDLSHDFGPPDEDQIEYLAEAFMEGENPTLQEEVAEWRAYFNVDGIGGEATRRAVPSAGCTPSEPERRAEPPDQTCFDAHLKPLDDFVWMATVGQKPHSSAKSLDNSRLEDGEVEEVETGTAEKGRQLQLERSRSTLMVVHAYEHFGFTVPLGMHPSTSLPKVEPQFAYRILRGYVPGLRDTDVFWNSREGQALIRFSMRLCTADHPPGYSWDLSKENQVPVLSLSRAKYLRSMQVQIPDRRSSWNNVVGRRAVQPSDTHPPQWTQLYIYWLTSNTENHGYLGVPMLLMP
ncbi:hypothetical protein NMY22_g6996 [Coprinellus aureogranulatus]|nr:hypothetical protein NMY22_g6996 [Coprinellus aureogranulatus]